MDHRVTGAWSTSPPAPCPREGCRGSLLWGLSQLFCSHDSHPSGTSVSVAAGSPYRLQWIWICRQLWAQKNLPGLLGGSYRGVWPLAGSPLEYVWWEGTQPSSHWEYTHQSLHAHLHPALLRASHRSLFFYLAHCLHIQVTPNRGTYLLLAPSELKGQWDKALRTGQSWSFFPHEVRRTAPLLPLPAPSACPVAPGITQGPSGLGQGGFRVHDMAPALRVPSTRRTTAGTRFIPGSWHGRKADAQWWASPEEVWECRLARDEDAVDPHTSRAGASQPLHARRDLPPRGVCCPRGRSVVLSKLGAPIQALDSQGSLQAAALNSASGIWGCSPPGCPAGRGGTERSLTLEQPLQGRDTGPRSGRPGPGRAAVTEAGDGCRDEVRQTGWDAVGGWMDAVGGWRFGGCRFPRSQVRRQ